MNSIRRYPDGIDCAWIASDGAGHAGAFVTGGSGPIPSRLLGEGFPAVEDVEGLIDGLPACTEARLLVSMERPESFLHLAARGFFVYDWRDVHRVILQSTYLYEPVAAPIKPVDCAALPAQLAAEAAKVKFAQLRFVDGLHLDVRSLVVCTSPPARA